MRAQRHDHADVAESQESAAPRIAALPTEPWPRGVSHKPTMNIGAVLDLLKREFPAVTHSKIRFLEEQGLVLPERTPAGYRVFSEADVERLRFALAAQRDSFLPLRVIRERLAAMDAGLDDETGPAPTADNLVPARIGLAELADLAGVSEAEILEIQGTGVIAPDGAGKYPGTALPLVQLALDLGRSGVDLRHLRMMRSAADRQVDVVAQLTAPLRGRQNAPQDARAREVARQTANDLSGMLSRLHAALVATGVERLF